MIKPLNPYSFEINEEELGSKSYWEAWADQRSKELSLPQSLVLDFQTEQDNLIAEIWHKDKLFEHTPLDFLIEEDFDKYTNELKISTFSPWLFCFPQEVPIVLLYISKPEGEQYYIVYTNKSQLSSTGSIVFNIDERTNIELKPKRKKAFLQGKTFEELKFWEWDNVKRTGEFTSRYSSYLPITKEDLLKCCYAKNIGFRARINDHSPIAYEEENCNELIPLFQMLVNKTSDNSLFADKREEWEQIIRKQWKKQVCDEINFYFQLDNEHKERETKHEDFIKKLEDNERKKMVFLCLLLAIGLGLAIALPFLV